MGGASFSRVFDIAGAIVMVALVTTVLRNGSSAAQVITAVTNGFSGTIRAAQGN